MALLLRAFLRKKSPDIQAVPVGGAPALAGATSASSAQLPAGQSEAAFEDRAMAQIAENRHVQEQAENDALETLRLVPTTRKSEVYRKFILEESKKDPGRVAQLMRSWLNSEGG